MGKETVSALGGLADLGNRFILIERLAKEKEYDKEEVIKAASKNYKLSDNKFIPSEISSTLSLCQEFLEKKSKKEIGEYVDFINKIIRIEIENCILGQENSIIDLSNSGHANIELCIRYVSKDLYFRRFIAKKTKPQDLKKFLMKHKRYEVHAILALAAIVDYKKFVEEGRKTVSLAEALASPNEFEANLLSKATRIIGIREQIWVSRTHNDSKAQIERLEEEKRQIKAVMSETGRIAAKEGRWDKRDERFKELYPEVDALAKEGKKHYEIAKVIHKKIDRNGTPIHTYFTSKGLSQAMDVPELKRLIKDYFVETNREHLIHGLHKK